MFRWYVDALIITYLNIFPSCWIVSQCGVNADRLPNGNTLSCTAKTKTLNIHAAFAEHTAWKHDYPPPPELIKYKPRPINIRQSRPSVSVATCRHDSHGHQKKKKKKINICSSATSHMIYMSDIFLHQKRRCLKRTRWSELISHHQTAPSKCSPITTDWVRMMLQHRKSKQH